MAPHGGARVISSGAGRRQLLAALERQLAHERLAAAMQDRDEVLAGRDVELERRRCRSAGRRP